MISVIVPVYNTYGFLTPCVKSIVNQSHEDLELILVNDGSTDNSSALCHKFAKKDSRVIVVDKRNEGVDKARFSGLQIAKGEYVTFVDSDDWLERDTLKVMFDNITKHEVDYVEVGMQRVFDKLKFFRKKTTSPVLGLISQPDLFDKYYISFFGCNILAVNMCGKLYRKDVIERASLNPSGLKMGEDLYFNLMLFPHLKSVYISDYIGYNYRFGGMTSKYNPSLFPNLKLLYQKKKELIDKYSYEKAKDFIIYEIVNVFKSDVQQKIKFKYKLKDDIISDISEELKDSLWDDILGITKKDYLEAPLPKAILQKDSDTVYSYCERMVEDQFLSWKIKLIVSKLLSRYL